MTGLLIGNEVTVFYNSSKGTIEGVGEVTRIHQRLFDDKYALVDLVFKTGILTGETVSRVVKND